MQLEARSVFHFTLLLKNIYAELLIPYMVMLLLESCQYADAVSTGHHTNRYLAQPLVQRVLVSLVSLLPEEGRN